MRVSTKNEVACLLTMCDQCKTQNRDRQLWNHTHSCDSRRLLENCSQRLSQLHNC